MATAFCPRCGRHIDGAFAFCPTCGGPLPPPQATQAPSSPPAAESAPFRPSVEQWGVPGGRAPSRLVSHAPKWAGVGTAIGLSILIAGTIMIGFGFSWIGFADQQYYSSCGAGVPSPSVYGCTHLAQADQNATWEGQLIIGIGAFVVGGGFAVYFTYLPRRVESALANVEWELY